MKTLAFAFLLFAVSPDIDIKTSELTSEPKMWVAGNRTVTADKVGDTTTVRVRDGEHVAMVIISKIDGKVNVTRSDNGAARRDFAWLQRSRISVDGMSIEPFLESTPAPEAWLEKQPRRDAGVYRFYVCPKDQSVLRVPPSAPEKTYTCPVDGAVMKSGVGPGKKYWLLD